MEIQSHVVQCLLVGGDLLGRRGIPAEQNGLAPMHRPENRSEIGSGFQNGEFLLHGKGGGEHNRADGAKLAALGGTGDFFVLDLAGQNMGMGGAPGAALENEIGDKVRGFICLSVLEPNLDETANVLIEPEQLELFQFLLDIGFVQLGEGPAGSQCRPPGRAWRNG